MNRRLRPTDWFIIQEGCIITAIGLNFICNLNILKHAGLSLETITIDFFLFCDIMWSV